MRRGSHLVLFHCFGLGCFIIIIFNCILLHYVSFGFIMYHFSSFLLFHSTSCNLSPPPPPPRPLAPHHPQQLCPSPVQNCAANKGTSAAPHPLLSSLPLSPTPIPPPPPKKTEIGEKKYIHGRGSDLCPCPAAHLVQAVRAAGRCDAVFRGFSDCLLRLGDNMANYPQDLDDKRNLQTICA